MCPIQSQFAQLNSICTVNRILNFFSLSFLPALHNKCFMVVCVQGGLLLCGCALQLHVDVLVLQVDVLVLHLVSPPSSMGPRQSTTMGLAMMVLTSPQHALDGLLSVLLEET
jgi:hypothetical protein